MAGFWLGRFEVTQGQWRSVMGGNPSAAQKGDDFPVECVSLPEAREFAARLGAGGTGAFRLPTELEWEFRRAQRRRAGALRRGRQGRPRGLAQGQTAAARRTGWAARPPTAWGSTT